MAQDPVPLSHKIYSTAVDLASPGITLFLWQRAFLGIDRWDKVHERFGQPSVEKRPKGPVFWFHGASIGECAMAVSLVERCLQERKYGTVLFTTQDTLSLSFIERTFPKDLVICQYAPIDTASAVDAFLRFWDPHCAILLECDFWPNLMLAPRLKQVKVAVVNARMSHRSFRRWSVPAAASIVNAMMHRVHLLTTPYNEQGLHFQLLGVNPRVVHFTGDLKFATQRVLGKRESQQVEQLRGQLGKRRIWVAACTHPGEEEVVIRVHLSMLEQLPDMLTIIAPRHPHRSKSITKMLRTAGLSVALRSAREKIKPNTQVYLADTTGEMGLWYALSPLAFVGGSMVPGVGGHNISEAAFGTCAVIVGPHMSNFQRMVEEMDRSAPLSVWQVNDESELRNAVAELLGNEAKLNARSIAAKRAASVASEGVVNGVWRHLNTSILSGSEPGIEVERPLREDGPSAELSPILHRHFLRAESERAPEVKREESDKESDKKAALKKGLHPVHSLRL